MEFSCHRAVTDADDMLLGGRAGRRRKESKTRNMTRRKKICGAGSAAEGIPAPPEPHQEPRRINQHRDAEDVPLQPAQRGLVPSVPGFPHGAQPFPLSPSPIPCAQGAHSGSSSVSTSWLRAVEGGQGKSGSPGWLMAGPGPAGTGDGADVTLWDVEGGTALKCGSVVRMLPGWREGCPSLLQHLWNLPGTLC